MASAYRKLSEPIQRVLHDARWDELRPIQSDSIHAIFDTDADLIIAASTASGKTEAAFLPILSKLIEAPQDGIHTLYIAPLKALINDQHLRLTNLLTHTHLPVHSWHGDVPGTQKQKIRSNPEGILLITPESLESCFINYSRFLPALFSNLQFIIIDELHAFVNDVRGVHLASLLSRLETIPSQRPRRLGLSATLGDFDQARHFLNRNEPEAVTIIEDPELGRDVLLGLRAYPNPSKSKPKTKDAKVKADGEPEISQLAHELARVFHSDSNLIFTNSRATAELLTDELSQISKQQFWPRNPFLIHHGSLSKEVRQDTEKRLKKGEPLSVFCTSTLEMGIDIGNVKAVGQLSAPWSVSSLAQRLGRSGRRKGESAILRMYALDDPLTKASTLESQLRPQLLRSIALVELLKEKWLEPGPKPHLQLSTFIQQILSILRQTGGASAQTIFDRLCQNGIFSEISVPDFKSILRSLSEHSLIEQMAEGLLILAPAGEQLTHDRDFYAAFQASEDFTIRSRGETIGLLPADQIPPVGENFILNGKRWVVEDLEHRSKIAEVRRTSAKKKPFFGGEPGQLHKVVREKMRSVLKSSKIYPYLHEDAAEELQHARKTFAQLQKGIPQWIQDGSQIRIFPWTGSSAMLTLSLCAKASGLECQLFNLSLVYQNAAPQDLSHHFRDIVNGKFTTEDLARILPSPFLEKYDQFLDEDILAKTNSHRAIALKDAQEVAMNFEMLPPPPLPHRPSSPKCAAGSLPRKIPKDSPPKSSPKIPASQSPQLFPKVEMPPPQE